VSATQLFNALFNAGLTVFLLTLVASLGMTFSVTQIVQPLRKGWLLAGVIVLNLGLAPLVAIGICHLFPLNTQARIGVEIVMIAAGGPACLKSCELAKRADLAMAVSFTIVLQLLNIVVVPLWAKAIITGATVNPWSIVGDLLLLILAPLVVGLILRDRYPEHRDSWKAGLEKTSNIALWIAIALGVAVNWNSIVSVLGSWVIVPSVLLIVVYAVLGWAVAFRNQQSAITVSNITAMRFTPIGLLVISTVLHNQGAYLTPALVAGFIDTIVPFAIAAEIGRYVSRGERKHPVAHGVTSPPAVPQPPSRHPQAAAVTRHDGGHPNG
jgi:BASS family bile acid:Na+ symporter